MSNEINISSGGIRNVVSTEFGGINVDYVLLDNLSLHQVFNGVVWCYNVYYNPNPNNPSTYDIIYNLIDGNGKPFIARQWGVYGLTEEQINKLKETPILIKGTVISISDKIYYRIDTIDFSNKYCNLPKSLFIKEIYHINTLSKRVLEYLEESKANYAIYWLTELNYLSRFKQSTYSETKSKYLGDKLAALDFILSSINRLKFYNSTEDHLLLVTYVVLYYCCMQDKQDFGKVNYKVLLNICSDDYYDKLIEIISLISQTRNYVFADNKNILILQKFISAFEELL